MMYIAKMTYKDGTTLPIAIKQSEFDDFFKSLKSKNFYWYKQGICGFWTNLADVRFIQVLPGDVDHEKEKTSKEGNAENTISSETV